MFSNIDHFGGSSYIYLPKECKNTRNELINIQNNDHMCFKWCHVAHMYPVIGHKYRVSKYTKHDKDVDYIGITFPVTLNQISKTEEQNEININIFQLDDDMKKLFYHYIFPITSMRIFVICY